MKNNVAIGALGVIFLLSGCAFDYYMPATQSVPLFTQKGDVKTLVSASLDKENYVGEVQCAYSMLDHVAISASFMGTGTKNNSQFDQPDGVAFNAALGYYKTFSESIVFETYGGIGTYSRYRRYNPEYALIQYDNVSDINAMNLFVQPNLGYVAPNFEFALSSRIAQWSFTKVENRTTPGTDEYDRLQQIARGKNFVLFEPALTLRGGTEYKKIQIQFVKTLPDRVNGKRLFDTFHISASLILVFPKGSQKNR